MSDICDERFGWSGSAVYPAVRTLGTWSQSWQPLMLLSGTVIDGEKNIWASSVSAKGLIENKNPPLETAGWNHCSCSWASGSVAFEEWTNVLAQNSSQHEQISLVFCKKPQCSDFLCLPLIPLFFSFILRSSMASQPLFSTTHIWFNLVIQG